MTIGEAIEANGKELGLGGTWYIDGSGTTERRSFMLREARHKAQAQVCFHMHFFNVCYQVHALDAICKRCTSL